MLVHDKDLFGIMFSKSTVSGPLGVRARNLSGLKKPRGDGCLFKSRKPFSYQLCYCLFTAEEQGHMATAEGKLLALEENKMSTKMSWG